MSELDLEVDARTFEGSRTCPEFPLMLSTPDGDGLAGVETVRLIEKDADGRTGRWTILPVGPHPVAPGARAALWPPLAANHSPNAAARRMADPPPVAPAEPEPDAGESFDEKYARFKAESDAEHAEAMADMDKRLERRRRERWDRSPLGRIAAWFKAGAAR